MPVRALLMAGGHGPPGDAVLVREQLQALRILSPLGMREGRTVLCVCECFTR